MGRRVIVGALRTVFHHALRSRLRAREAYVKRARPRKDQHRPELTLRLTGRAACIARVLLPARPADFSPQPGVLQQGGGDWTRSKLRVVKLLTGLLNMLPFRLLGLPR
jgi:hypothetical protein